jgi:hypothetical protein
VALVIPACVAAAIGVGWAFHRLVERHFLNQPTRDADRAIAPGAGTRVGSPPARVPASALPDATDRPAG